MLLQRDPQTTTEWQNAADVSALLLALKQAEVFGLVNPALSAMIDFKKCKATVIAAQAHGVQPRQDALEWFRRSAAL